MSAYPYFDILSPRHHRSFIPPPSSSCPFFCPCPRNVVRLIIVATVLTTATVTSLQATILSWDSIDHHRWRGRASIVPGGPHPVEIRAANSPIGGNGAYEGELSDPGRKADDLKVVATGDEISPCSPDHPNSIKGTGLFLSLQELDPDALVTDYFDAETCKWDLLKLETYVVVTRLDAEKQQQHADNGDEEDFRDETTSWDGDTSAYFDQVICVSGGVGTIWGMFNPPARLIKLTAQCKEGGQCFGVFIGNLLIYVWCAIFLLGIPELVLVWVQCGWNQVAWLWVVWVTFFIARTQTAWIEYLRSSAWCRQSSYFRFLSHAEERSSSSSSSSSSSHDLSNKCSTIYSSSRNRENEKSGDRAAAVCNNNDDDADDDDDSGEEILDLSDDNNNYSSSRSTVSGGMIGEGFFNPHSLELFSGWERWDWIDLGVFAGMVVFVAGVSVQLLESCGWDCLAYFVLVVSGIDEVVWLWRSKKGSSSGSSSRRGGLPRSLLQLRRHTRSRKSNKKIMGGGRGSNDDRRGIADEQSQGWGYGEGLGLHMWLWLAGAVVLCTWRASVALHLLFLFAFCVYHWTMKEKLPHLNF